MIKCRVCGCDITPENEVSAMVNRRGKIQRRVFHICRTCDRNKPYDKERKTAYNKVWRAAPENKAIVSENGKRWRSENPERCLNNKRKWRANNRDKYRALGRAYYNRHKNDHWHITRGRISARLSAAIRHRGTTKYGNTMELVGCDRETLIAHLESTFQPGMSWENRNMWDIDHIIPCDSFDLTIPEQQRQCFHYTNLQALWSFDNRSKGNRILTKSQ